MREITKSVFSFSWALTAFGTEQMLNLLVPSPGWRRASGALDTVTRAATSQLAGPTRGLFQAGDQVQRSVVDLLLGWSQAALSTTNQAVQAGTSAATSAAAQTAQAVSSATPPPATGWGPIGRS